MAINFDSIISNTKGAANIAKIKVTLGLKVNELSKLYAEVGKLFYEVTRNNNAFLTQSLVLSKDRTLNTEGKTTFNIMKDRITVVNEKIDYSKD